MYRIPLAQDGAGGTCECCPGLGTGFDVPVTSKSGYCLVRLVDPSGRPQPGEILRQARLSSGCPWSLEN